jgi:hypothetical protein
MKFKKCYLYKFCFLFFIFIGVQYIWFDGSEEYKNVLKSEMVLIDGLIDNVVCKTSSKRSDYLIIKVKGYKGFFSTYIDGNIRCDFFYEKIKPGMHVVSYVNSRKNQIISLKVNDKILMPLNESLKRMHDAYSNYYMIYFVIAFMFLMLIIKSKDK